MKNILIITLMASLALSGHAMENNDNTTQNDEFSKATHMIASSSKLSQNEKDTLIKNFSVAAFLVSKITAFFDDHRKETTKEDQQFCFFHTEDINKKDDQKRIDNQTREALLKQNLIDILKSTT